MKKTIAIATLFVLSGCQLNPQELSSEKGPLTAESIVAKEIFDASLGDEMVQIDAKEISQGYMYTFTNNGIAPQSRDIKKKAIIVEIQGGQEPYRLKDIFPAHCSEISYSDQVVNQYRTWVDVLACPYYEDASAETGLLVINKSVQGSEMFFGATVYRTIPRYAHKQVTSYRELGLSGAELEDIERFIRETAIKKAESESCCASGSSNGDTLSRIAALNLSAKYLTVQQVCHYSVSDIYLGSLTLSAGINAKSESFSEALEAQAAKYRNRIKEKQSASIEEACRYYEGQIDDDIEAHLSTLSVNKSTSGLQDKGLFELTNALQARDACDYEIRDRLVQFNEAHNLTASDFASGGKHRNMFFYYGIRAGLDMKNIGRSAWCKTVKVSKELLNKS